MYSHRLSPKEKASADLAAIFSELVKKTGKSLDTISGCVRVSVLQLKQIEGGKAYTLETSILLKVFEFLPIDDPEARIQVPRLIASVASNDRGRFYPHTQRGFYFHSQR